MDHTDSPTRGYYLLASNEPIEDGTYTFTVLDKDGNTASRAIKREEVPEDLLGAVVFFSSSDSDFITGQSIAIDGGWTIA